MKSQGTRDRPDSKEFALNWDVRDGQRRSAQGQQFRRAHTLKAHKTWSGHRTGCVHPRADAVGVAGTPERDGDWWEVRLPRGEPIADGRRGRDYISKIGRGR